MSKVVADICSRFTASVGSMVATRAVAISANFIFCICMGFLTHGVVDLKNAGRITTGTGGAWYDRISILWSSKARYRKDEGASAGSRRYLVPICIIVSRWKHVYNSGGRIHAFGNAKVQLHWRY